MRRAWGADAPTTQDPTQQRYRYPANIALIVTHRKQGLLTRYSNRSDILHELDLARGQLERASQDEPDRRSVRSVRSPDRKGRVWGLAERLSYDDIRKIALSYEAGELRQDIAARYKISVSSVGRLLRKWRAERDGAA